jgi:hypothetical protein
MSGRGGTRVVLIIPRDKPESAPRLKAALDELARLGWIPTAIVDPTQHLDALRMVLDGVVDTVVATDPSHMPSLRLTGTIDRQPGAKNGRTQMVARNERTAPVERVAQTPAPDHPWRPRPQLVRDEPAEATAEPLAQRSQPVTRTKVPTPSVERRSAQRSRVIRRTA